jgi:hypothetical protein
MHDLVIALSAIGMIVVPLIFAAKCPTYKASAFSNNLPARMNLHALRPGPDRCYASGAGTNDRSRDGL